MKLNVTTTIKMESDSGKFAIVKLVDKYKKGKIKCEKDFRIILHEDYNQNGYNSIEIYNQDYIENKLYSFLNAWCFCELNNPKLNGVATSPNYDILKDDEDVYNYFIKCNKEDIFNFIVILEEAMLCGFIDDTKELNIFGEFIGGYINAIN